MYCGARVGLYRVWNNRIKSFFASMQRAVIIFQQHAEFDSHTYHFCLQCFHFTTCSLTATVSSEPAVTLRHINTFNFFQRFSLVCPRSPAHSAGAGEPATQTCTCGLLDSNTKYSGTHVCHQLVSSGKVWLTVCPLTSCCTTLTC